MAGGERPRARVPNPRHVPALPRTPRTCPPNEADRCTLKTDDYCLQAAFKKLRVDTDGSDQATTGPQEKITAANPVLPPAPADSWTRKGGRSALSRPRRRRSKSPILHPPKFTYFSTTPPKAKTSFCQSGWSEQYPGFSMSASPELASTSSTIKSSDLCSQGRTSVAAAVEVQQSQHANLGISPSAVPEDTAKHSDAFRPRSMQSLPDFQQLSETARKDCDASTSPAEDVYCFTGLRESLQAAGVMDAPCRYLGTTGAERQGRTAQNVVPPRSCSEQVRVVDDTTIEDLSGYFENFLYLPQKMSTMAEMMYA
uniref:oxidative stress-responsive serine-rich protein 1 n=1 Tax=Myxine glutinosa TaxID=7769 RepID=UPI00358F954C